ncbi:MAG: aminotransferase class V-fold PLP-dependent enzyme [Erythrobacter sp.]|uniref:cysteine desulfurase family protein n=1 Tax=Erythrobacter sp. TaxID=1042 RepID=UPI002616CF51|nr:aminotransferase class V-fold PLP-dependent enzyme [Erythrobacter sp.]MDJ0976951.1 aminotransferase class V-fold PLP-dependent enzyme [Erythrobacter sp.]
MQRIYLDHAATSPLRPEAKAAMEEGFRIWANPSSPHAEGRKAKAALEDARERIKAALGWDGELIFTSGASEALWIALNRSKAKRRVVSAVEHDAVFRAAPDAEVVPLDDIRCGPDLDHIETSLERDGNAVVALQAVNSETGLCFFQDHGFTNTRDVHELVRNKGGLLVSDCSQAAGRVKLPNADMIVISAHKFGGPIGIGALLVRDYAMLEPIGGHERGYRQGTENMPAALGMAAALECWMPGANPSTKSHEFESARIEYASYFETGYECGYIVPFVHPTLSAQALLIRLDAMGFAVSAGSACSSGTLKKSRVLDAFGVPDDVAARTIRVSLGWSTTPEELERFAEAWGSLV